ncbi:hypothetical protein CRE_08799 [Caenorhabditis remanei]|uniref:Seven TM Receptor n=1 Tax=Caenorhabditis remanei TaxID=31234 RepID=E3LHK4_CAERE|nr:hypothetical protein CRE_08799 [Caenorhabditis remanei]
MKFSHWVNIARFVAKLGFVTTSFSSTLFLILTIFYVKEKVGSYRYLLLLLPISGFFFVSFEYLIDPVRSHHDTDTQTDIFQFFHSYKEGFTLFRMSSFENLSLSINTFILACYVALYGSTISVLALQFTYRYWAIFRPRYIRMFFDGPRFIFPVLYTTLGGFSWWFASFFFSRLDDYSSKYLEKDVFESYGVILSEQPALVLVAYDGEGNLRIKNSLGLLIMALFLGVQYAIIIYLAIVMALKMQLKLSCLSKRVQLMHRQFYHALVLQITAPTVTLFFPVFILYFVPYVSIEISFPTGTCLSAFALYPAMDICIMIYIASYYNKALKGLRL